MEKKLINCKLGDEKRDEIINKDFAANACVGVRSIANHIAEAQLEECRDYMEKQVQEAEKKLLKDKLTFIVPNKNVLKEVGEWAECQGPGAFVWFEMKDWKKIQKRGK